jgi:hypothetical protein
MLHSTNEIRVHRHEDVELFGVFVRPVRAGVEGDRQFALLQRSIDRNVAIVVHRREAHAGHHEAEDALASGELFDDAQTGVGLAERQIEQRLDAVVLVENLVAEPPVVGDGKLRFDPRLRMRAERQHVARKQHLVVHSQCLDRAPDQCHVAMHRTCRRPARRVSADDGCGRRRPGSGCPACGWRGRGRRRCASETPAHDEA